MTDELFTKAQTEAIVAVAKATVEKTIAETSMPEWIMGKVMAVEQSNVTGTVAHVSLDGDPEENTIPCPVVIPFAVAPGDRVTLAFSPPHQHLVVGFLRTEGLPVGIGRLGEIPDDSPTAVQLDILDVLQGGFTWDSVHRGWVIPTKGVYATSATVQPTTGPYPT